MATKETKRAMVPQDLMNDLLSDPRPTGLELEPWTKGKPLSILLPDDRAIWITWLEGAVLAFAVSRFVASPVVDGLLGLVCLAGLVVRFRKRSLRLELGWKEIRATRSGRTIDTILYGNIASVQLRREDSQRWLSITTLAGRTINFPCKQAAWMRFRQEILLVSNLGPRLAPGTEFGRGKRPVTPMHAEIFDHFYHVPLVEMEQGVPYRNKYAADFLKSFVKPQAGIEWLSYFVSAYLFLFADVSLLWSIPVAIVVMILFKLQRREFLTQLNSISDLYRRVPEGLEVTRRGKTWIVPLQKPGGLLSKKIWFQHGYFVRYGSGKKATYLDHRFLEPCQAAPLEIGDNHGAPGLAG